MSKTEQNLMDAFAGESQANRRYLAFAKKADKDGFPQAAKLFRAAAEASNRGAHTHLKTLGAIKSTAENLKEAIAGETHEFNSMYPAMIAEAETEGNKAAVRTFTYANEVEKVHAALYQKALDSLEKPSAVESYYVCSVCGFDLRKRAAPRSARCARPPKRRFSGWIEATTVNQRPVLTESGRGSNPHGRFQLPHLRVQPLLCQRPGR